MRKAIIRASNGSSIPFPLTLEGEDDGPAQALRKKFQEKHGVASMGPIGRSKPGQEMVWACIMGKGQKVDLIAMGETAFNCGFDLQGEKPKLLPEN